MGRGKEELINRSMDRRVRGGWVSARVRYARRRRPSSSSSSSSSSAVSICLVGSVLWGVSEGERNVRVWTARGLNAFDSEARRTGERTQAGNSTANKIYKWT